MKSNLFNLMNNSLCIICQDEIEQRICGVTFRLQDKEVVVCEKCAKDNNLYCCSVCENTIHPYDDIFLVPPINAPDWISLCRSCGDNSVTDIVKLLSPLIRTVDIKRLTFILEQMLNARSIEIDHWLECRNKK